MSALYDKGREAILSALIDMTSATIKATLVKSSYTPALTTHQFLSDLGANTVGTDQTLTSKTVTAGVFDAADTSHPSVAASSAIAYIALYKDTGSSATSPLICLIDAVLTTGGSTSTVAVTWDNTGNKIFKL